MFVITPPGPADGCCAKATVLAMNRPAAVIANAFISVHLQDVGLVFNVRIFSNAGYDPRKDFAPLGLIASAPALLLVHRDLPVHSVGELIALMKASKEPYQVATPGAGTVNYLASILFAQQAGVQVQQIIEKGSNPLITDMMGG